jgi:hypothetical protein
MRDRSVVSIDTYWQAIAKLLWTRFETIMSMHNESVKAVDPRKLQTPVDTRPHYLIRRYAEFTCALLTITSLSGKKMDERLQV